MNKVILLGRLTKDPEVRYTEGEKPVAVGRYTLAVNRRWKREGETEADFIPCVVFGKSATFAEKYFTKGKMIGIVGRLQVRIWTDRDGNKRMYYSGDFCGKPKGRAVTRQIPFFP